MTGSSEILTLIVQNVSMAIGRTSWWAMTQAQNARRRANYAAAAARSDAMMSSLMSAGANNTKGLVALTEQLLRTKSANKLAASKAAATKAQTSLNKLA
jgi:hypothetical protein